MRWVLYPFFALMGLAVMGVATLAAVAAFAWPKLPSLEILTDYRPKIPLRIYTSDGHLIGEYGEERRTFVTITDVPAVLKHAILSAEDERFYEHPGVDLLGIARAASANLISGGKAQGASTITMQVARNFFLTREKTITRKLYEILLSLKIEQNLSKDQILELYVNQIYLGRRAYGFSAAARTYYGKQLSELTVGEAAMLAGLPKAPSAYNPVVNPSRAQLRQHYVLRRMHELRFIDDTTLEAARAEPIRTAKASAADRNETSFFHADYVAEMARQIAVEQFEDKAYELGIRIITTITRDEQEAAYQALRDGLLAYDRRHGYRGPEKFMELPPAGDLRNEAIETALGEVPDYGDMLAAVVTQASPKSVTVYRGGKSITIGDKGLRFAAPMLSEKAPAAKRIRPGAIVRIRDEKKDGWQLTQLPDVEGALVAIDSDTGAVRALVGGFDFYRNKFNHATQAMRQPGSGFKPFIFSAALERGYSPGTYVEDEPLYFPAGVTGSQEWEPGNYDHKYEGPITLRRALAKSKNMVSIRLLQSVSPNYAQDYISRFGFPPQNHPAYLTMALGAGAATPWEMATGYAVFANGGYRVQPYVIKEILDDAGNTIAKVDPPVAGKTAAKVIDERNAFVMDSMLQEVVRAGTATRALKLKRGDLAGKTGTTNDYVDAWFCGYNPEVVAISWVGFDQPKNLGRGETGGATALPIWIDYMKVALEGRPETKIPQPSRLNHISARPDVEPDWVYAENEAPMPPELPEMMLEDGSVAMEAPNEAIPAFPAELFGGRRSAPPPMPVVPRTQAPAPVEDLRPTPAPVINRRPNSISAMPQR
ncbi:PBP1A family penicillin-binding protein [Denitromonas halophila]|uniref:Penicillin-binding protein 1A n=1 Tax=Denitromonas halophila TaxID=1629404 RepID=A0A557QXG1_9RHOO|nr:PBP1A family penicillin-binding protein [Denitromonas halophila]TVO57604.1 PBP1A family penicillin-binding protein [Denitromonas halophila]